MNCGARLLSRPRSFCHLFPRAHHSPIPPVLARVTGYLLETMLQGSLASSESSLRVPAHIWWWFGCWAAGQGSVREETVKQPCSRLLPAPLNWKRAPKRPAGIAADLPGKGVKALFLLLASREEFFLRCFCGWRMFLLPEERPPPQASPSFLRVSSSELTVFSIHSQVSLLGRGSHVYPEGEVLQGASLRGG